MPTSLESSIVRICTADGDVVGAGFLVGARQILTCAHVIAGVLGLPDDTPENPQTAVHLDFPRVAPGQLLTARVILWRPPQADGGGDIAGIELNADPPSGVQIAPLARVDDLWEHSFRAFGFPKGEENGVWATGRLLGRQATNWVQIEDVKETGFPVEPGFSGTPVWDPQLEAVVGMVVAAERRMAVKTAFAIPVDVLVSTWAVIESLIQPFVFLCYARADSELVMHLRADLGTRGMNIWIDREGLEPGTPDWEESLRTAIRAAQAVLLIASPNGRNSRYVRDELRLAEMYQRPLYPIWMAGTQWMEAVPLGWGGVQYIDAREARYETALEEIVDTLSGISAALSRNVAPSRILEQGSEPRNPYKGLRAFTSEDAGDFFGRDTLINALVETLKELLAKDVQRIQSTRLLVVMGPSGSGKSSLVMAGLLPCLERDGLPGSRNWVYLTPIVPGMHPMESLMLSLAEHLLDRSLKAIREDLEDDSARGLHLLASHIAKRSETRVVLLVDQFEEVFTQTSSEEERRRFLDILMTAITEPHGPLVLLLTLRADFYDRPSQYPELALLIKDHHQLVLPMEMKNLQAVIEKPAALPDVQLTFEGDLVGDLLFEVQGQVGILPLLQFTLDQLFQKRSGHLLTLAAYREMGGVRGALIRQAESTYAALPSEVHHQLARALFVRLIDLGVTEQDNTRRRASLSEFALADATQTRLLQETADAFIAARLLTTNEVAGITTLEVSHEALIREWTRLSEWLREARDDIYLQQAISEDVAEWVRRGRPVDRLYRGSLLSEAQAWAERNMPSRDEVAFLLASATEYEQQRVAERNRKLREVILQRRVVSRQRLLVAVLSIFLVVVIILATAAEVGRQQADTQRQLAEIQGQIASSRALAAQANYALVQNNLDRALLLSVRANQTYNTFDARDSLLTALEYSPRLITILHHGTGGQSTTSPALAFSSDGQTLASFTPDASRLWNTKTGKLSPSPLTFQLNFSIETQINSFLVSPDSQILAATGDTGLWVENIKMGTPTVQLVGDTQGIPPHPYSFSFPVIAFSSDGKTLASSRCVQYTAEGGGNTCTKGRILLWDVSSHKPTNRVLITQGGIAISMAFSPDRKTLAVSDLDGTVQLWNLASRSLSGQFTVGHAQDFINFPEQKEDITFSPNGRLVVSGNSDGTITVWDAVSQKLVGPPLVGHSGAVEQLAFSPDGNTLASGSDDKTIRLWNFDRQSPYPVFLQPLRGHTGSISSLAFSPDNKMLASSDVGGTTLLWNLAADSSIKQKLEYQSDVHSTLLSPDGNVIVTGDDKGMITFRDVTTGKFLDTLDATMDPTNIPSSQPYVDDGPLTIESLALSSDGHILAAGRFDGMILLWDMRTKKPITHFRLETRLRSITFNQDGQILASSHNSGTILLWDVVTGKVLHHLTHHTTNYNHQMSTTAFSMDGKLLASGNDNAVIFWDVTTGKRTGMTLVGHTASVRSVAFSPDKKTLASIDDNSTIILWDVESGKSIHQPFFNFDQDTGVQTYFNSGFTFSPDGTMLVLGGYSTITLWDVTRGETVAHSFQEDKDALGQSIAVRDVTFSPNGRRLVVIFTEFSRSHITLWDIDKQTWQALACTIANRNFTSGEWNQFVGTGPYRKVCSNLPVDGSVTKDELSQADADAQKGQNQNAMILYAQATQEAAQIGDADLNYSVCWHGSIHQFAKVVLSACNLAVALSPSDGDFHDGRGLSRALTGNTKGAINDFKFFVQWTTDFLNTEGVTPDTRTSYKQRLETRTVWIQELEVGHNPFDAKTLKALLSE